jgi:hypothetical protein
MCSFAVDMAQLLPGVRHWTAVHPEIGWTVSSYALEEEGVLLNPLLPDGDRSVVADLEIRAIVLTNRLHLRDSELLAGDGVVIHVPEAVLWDLGEVRAQLAGYEDGDELPGNLKAYGVGALSDDEFAVFAPAYRALAVADGVIRDGDGPLEAVPDSLMGDDPEADRRGLAQAFTRLCDELDFDHLLLAHGLPVIGNGREQLRQYAVAL